MADDRLTDTELESLLFYACSSGTGTPAWVRDKIQSACMELAERRAAERRSEVLQTRLENQRHEFVQAKTHGGCEECGYPEHEELKHLPTKRCYCNELGPLSLRSGDICGFCERQQLVKVQRELAESQSVNPEQARFLMEPVPLKELFGDRDNTQTEEQRFSMGARLNRIGEEERLLEKDPTIGPALDIHARIPIEVGEMMPRKLYPMSRAVPKSTDIAKTSWLSMDTLRAAREEPEPPVRWANLDGMLHVAGGGPHDVCGCTDKCNRCGARRHMQPVYGAIDYLCEACPEDADRWRTGRIPLHDEIGIIK